MIVVPDDFPSVFAGTGASARNLPQRYKVEQDPSEPLKLP